MDTINYNSILDGILIPQSDNDYNLSILVPTQFVGLLIGKNGSCFRDLAKSSLCRLYLQAYEDIPELSRERVLSMNGTKQAVLVALRKIIELIQPCTKSIGSQAGSCESQLDGSQLIKWVILQANCGNLIGRGGEGIKKINELSGSWVKVAHLEDSVRGAKERLVYIRGTPEQNIVALKLIIEKVGGWPFTTPVYDHEIAKIEDKTTVYIPFLAIPIILFGNRNFHGNLFPSNTDPPIIVEGATVLLDANFLTSSAETQLHLIGPAMARERAKIVIMERLRNWLLNPEVGTPICTSALTTTSHMNGSDSEDLSPPPNLTLSTAFLDLQINHSSGSNNNDTTEHIFNTQLSENSYNLFIPRQFSVQFANQFSLNDHTSSSLFSADPMLMDEIDTSSSLLSSDSKTISAYRPMLSHSLDNPVVSRNNQTLFSSPSIIAGDFEPILSANLNRMDMSSSVDNNSSKLDILDCCIKLIIAYEAAPYVSSIFPQIQTATSCYVQLLPSQNVVTKTVRVAKISIIGDRLNKILQAQELLLDFCQKLQVSANPEIPFHVDRGKAVEPLATVIESERTHQQKGFIEMLQQQNSNPSSNRFVSSSSSSASASSLGVSQQSIVSDIHSRKQSLMSIHSRQQSFISDNSHNHNKCHCSCTSCLSCSHKTDDNSRPISLEEFLKLRHPDVLTQYISIIGRPTKTSPSNMSHHSSATGGGGSVANQLFHQVNQPVNAANRISSANMAPSSPVRLPQQPHYDPTLKPPELKTHDISSVPPPPMLTIPSSSNSSMMSIPSLSSLPTISGISNIINKKK